MTGRKGKGRRNGSTAEGYRLEWGHEALKRLRRLPRNRQRQIATRLEALAVDPTGPQPQAKRLEARPGLFRLRIGEWRAIYVLDHVMRVIRVLKIEPGHDVY